MFLSSPEIDNLDYRDRKVVESKTLWSLFLLSFSYSRNFKTLFIILTDPFWDINPFFCVIDGLTVMCFGWVILQNAFLVNFYTMPINNWEIPDIAK